jgi:signal transduction histidine kinase
MRNMIRHGRFYRAGAVVIALLLLSAIVAIAEVGESGQKAINARVQLSLRRQVALADLLSQLSEADTGQRGFLLTNDPKYLEPYESARARIEPTLDQLGDLFRQDAQHSMTEEQRNISRHLRVLVGTKLGELAASLALYKSEGQAQAVALVRTDVGDTTMADIRSEVTKLRDAERFAVSGEFERADRLLLVSRSLMAAAILLNVALLILAAVLLSRQARRRTELTQQLAVENEELERRVRQRTVELSALSSHLQQLSEKEKAGLARELHDELGGLLIAVKMDVAWLQKRWPGTEPEIQGRWHRVLKVLDDGVDFKRRIIENLRPTLLDNMGLFPALRWTTQETCSRAGLHYVEEYPDQEPELIDDAAIMIFRLVQESLMNVVKHAKATDVRVAVAIDSQFLEVDVEDNGTGIAPERLHSVGSHGLATMRHRVRSFGGQFEIDTADGGGTRIHVRLPLSRLLKSTAIPLPEAANN